MRSVTGEPVTAPEDDVVAELRRLGDLALLLCGNAAEAEDAAAEAVARVLGRRQLSEIEQVGPYLRRTLVNVIARRERRRGYELRALSRSRSSRPSRSVDEVASERSDIARALRALPLEQRAVVVLRYCEDRSEQEVSEILGLALGTVKSRTSRALAAMRPMLKTGDDYA